MFGKERKLKKVILSIFCLGLLSILTLPTQGLAVTSEFGIADMTWNYSTLMYTPTLG